MTTNGLLIFDGAEELSHSSSKGAKLGWWFGVMP